MQQEPRRQRRKMFTSCGLWLSLLLTIGATSAHARCVEWWVCPYVQYEDETCTRYLPIADLDLTSRWQEIEVDGNQALICLFGDEDVGASGCTEIRPQQVRPLLQPPTKPFCDNGVLRFHDGQQGRQNIKRPFNQRVIRRTTERDPVFDDGVLKERSRHIPVIRGR